jgi:hypothetical protein
VCSALSQRSIGVSSGRLWPTLAATSSGPTKKRHAGTAKLRRRR